MLAIAAFHGDHKALTPDIDATLPNGHKVRVLPILARCGERQFTLDLTFVDHSAKVSEEPIPFTLLRDGE